MARTLKTVDSGRIVFAGLEYLYMTPWVTGDDGKLALAGETFNLVNIVGDTVTVEQEDNEVNEIAHEFSAAPLYENIKLGKKTFSAECIDFQNDVLQNLLGWKISTGTNIDYAAAPITYTDKYVAIELGFTSTDEKVVLPKVKLNSKAALSSLKTDASRATLSGTCYSAYCTIGSATSAVETDMFRSKFTISNGHYSLAEDAATAAATAEE